MVYVSALAQIPEPWELVTRVSLSGSLCREGTCHRAGLCAAFREVREGPHALLTLAACHVALMRGDQYAIVGESGEAFPGPEHHQPGHRDVLSHEICGTLVQ